MTRETNARGQLIGMLHVPINTLLNAPPSWRQSLGVPELTADDFVVVAKLPEPCLGLANVKCRCTEAVRKEIKLLSVWSLLARNILAEASIYAALGVQTVMLENVAAPYFVRGTQPPLVYWIMRALADVVKAAYPNLRIGIQILAFSDDWAMDIACRCNLDFIRSESALFDGVRPEGRMPNQGNLAKLYMMRNMLMTQTKESGPGPLVYVDVQKKHTVFASELDSLDVWLENILFQKLEGIVITGKATGQPVEEDDLRQSRDAIEKVKGESLAAVGMAWAPQLIVGSGASTENIAMCKRYADAVIVGSSLKKNGYWECPLDEERVKRFMEAWNE